MRVGESEGVEPTSARIHTVAAGRSKGAQGERGCGFCCRSSRVPPEIGVPATRELGQAARRTEGATCRVCDGLTPVGFVRFICTSLLSVAHLG